MIQPEVTTNDRLHMMRTLLRRFTTERLIGDLQALNDLKAFTPPHWLQMMKAQLPAYSPATLQIMAMEDVIERLAVGAPLGIHLGSPTKNNAYDPCGVYTGYQCPWCGKVKERDDDEEGN